MKSVASFVSGERSSRGSIAIVIALGMLGVMMLVGLVIEQKRLSDTRFKLQVALDNALLAAATAPAGDQVALAGKYFDANAAQIPGGTRSALFTPSGSQLSGSAQLVVPGILMPLFGKNSMTINVQGTVEIGGSGSNMCVLLTAPNTSQALTINSGAQFSSENCVVHVRSSASNAAVFNSGTNLNVEGFCVKSSSVIDNTGGKVPGLEKNCDAAADPFAGTLPPPPSTTCDYWNLNFNSGTYTLNPGVYCGWMNFNSGSNVNLNPGLYVIKNGGWNVNGGQWNGTGVTFYYADTSKIQFNSGIKANLKPPTSGPLKDIIFYEKDGLSPSDFILNDANGFDIEGLMYLPSRRVTYNSGSTMTSRKLMFVFYTLTMNNTKLQLGPTSFNSGSTSGAVVRLMN